MQEVKVLHIADTHIGRKYNNLSPKKATVRSSEILLTLENALERFSDAQIVLLSGDVFEEDLSQSALEFVCKLFESRPQMRFFLSCGNHDCYTSPVIKHLCNIKPDNLNVFPTEITEFEIDELNVSVYGASFGAPIVQSSLLRGFRPANEDKINIMVMHGDVSVSSMYNPISLQDIEDSKLDYLALGHIHSFNGFNERGNTCYAYPGIAEPGGFDETDECGVIYGTVSKNSANLEFYPISFRQYKIICLDVSELTSHEEVIREIRKIVNEKNFYRINLIGSPQTFFVDPSFYTESTDAFYIEVFDNTDSFDSILNYCNEKSLRGNTARALLGLKDSSAPEVYDEAEKILTNLMCRG